MRHWGVYALPLALPSGVLAEKARAKAALRVDLSDIPLTHRRDRIEVSAGLRTSVPPVRIAVVRLGSRHEVFDIGALSTINFDPQ